MSFDSPLIVTVAPNQAYKTHAQHAGVPISAAALTCNAKFCLKTTKTHRILSFLSAHDGHGRSIMCVIGRLESALVNIATALFRHMSSGFKSGSRTYSFLK